ncbi:hypothetical protein AKJ51_00590 [candidate division MSBL1 archaeon SCGC-AAA382A20]|uniref:DUF5615 domain-containing protein n=1 Tax=candidate division MSBL1 archaeon SCGC-AAA382A20 TaxID=1698280 RepID=A0A133VMJ1_9EURY|nr:hypothetical protein AKJ51_00590 [candidate division MSBL1 archaeon SCGC-AAA382A20]
MDVPKSTAKIIEECGYLAKEVRNVGLKGATDEEIMEQAKSEERIIIRDTDFGDVILYPKHP